MLCLEFNIQHQGKNKKRRLFCFAVNHCVLSHPTPIPGFLSFCGFLLRAKEIIPYFAVIIATQADGHFLTSLSS
jgi:hypothetical protein